MNNEIKQFIHVDRENMIAFRRDLHRHPELPFEEVRTTQCIADALDAIGIDYRLAEPTGVIADIYGGKSGKTVALRADIDALPVLELNDNIDYQSTYVGKMHACGHDSHTAMLLSAAKALYQVREQITGNIRLIFQPAEEIAQGAKKMIEQGALDHVDNVFGMHIWSQTPSGRISCHAGPSFAAADILKIRFTGRGGHGSMPQDCIDAVVVASSFVMNLQAVVAREIPPLDPAVVTIGRMEVGTRFNVIAENALLEGTVRCFDLETRKKLEKAIRRYAQKTAEMYGATVDIDYIYGTLPLINEQRSSALAEQVVKAAFGEHALYKEKPTTGAEDFSFYQENIPGCYALIGCGNPEKGTNVAHHHGCFNVDEDMLVIGAELYAQYALAYLEQNAF